MSIRSRIIDKPWKTLACTIAVAELAGFAASPETAIRVNRESGELIAHAGVWVADIPLQRAVCAISSILPRVEYANDCVQSYFDRPDKIAGSGSAVIDLVSSMERVGFDCGDSRIVVAVNGDSPIGLVMGAGNTSETANQAKALGAFDGIELIAGQQVNIADCD